jgi:predicted nucleic acid-binding protein
VILDTNAISALLKNDEALVAALGRDDHHLPVIALGEYRYGLMRSTLREQLEERLRRWESIWPVLSIGAETAAHYARVREHLRARGTPIPENDVWIAALASQYALPVCSRDGHFDSVAGLVRVCW